MEEMNDGAIMRWPTQPVGTITWWTDEPEICFNDTITMPLSEEHQSLD